MKDEACVEEEMMEAVRVVLEGLGEDVCREGLLKTPLRVARSLLFATQGYQQLAENIIGDAIFPEGGLQVGVGHGGGSGGMVVIRNVDLFSLCQACLLPFKVCCHLAYIPYGQKVVGLSKLSRLAEMFARRLQTPKKLAKEIRQALANTIKPQGIAIVLQCWHPQLLGRCAHNMDSCIRCEQHRYWQSFSVCTGEGLFEDSNSGAWAEFLGILLLDGIVIDNLESALHDADSKDGWCHCRLDNERICAGYGTLPFSESIFNGSSEMNLGEYSSRLILRKTETRVNDMIAAVESIVLAISRDLESEEIRLTSKRFVHWLLYFDFHVEYINIHPDDFEGDNTMLGINGCFSDPSSNEVERLSGVQEGGNSPLSIFTIPFLSQCEHHLLPFYGVAHIGHLATERKMPLERPTIQALVEISCRRLQVQERLTKQIAESIVSYYGVNSVMVVLEASHTCMISRGVEKVGSSTATVAVTGRFMVDVSAKAAFLQKLSTRDVRKNMFRH